uniref:Uncharacterized protein n=1 Tax=Rhizobium leguminosarum TaxID=384 RepID=A0A179BA20_RHILE|nr:hypothetical protein A4U53_09195 [Rhizobium leguminosarum]
MHRLHAQLNHRACGKAIDSRVEIVTSVLRTVAAIVPLAVVTAITLVPAVKIAIIARSVVAAALTVVDHAAFGTATDATSVKSAAVDGLGLGGNA